MRCVPKHKNSKKDIDLPPPLHMQTINTLTPGFQKKVRAGLQRHFTQQGERPENMDLIIMKTPNDCCAWVHNSC
jgi:hypothetical protein